jgi:hypothetical protein
MALEATGIGQMRQGFVLRLSFLLAAVSACGLMSEAPPEMTPQFEAELTARAASAACNTTCAGHHIFVRDELFTIDTSSGQGEPMPALTQDSVRQALGDVTFIDEAESFALFDPQRDEEGRGVLLIIGPIQQLATDVIGIDVGVTVGFTGSGQTYLFQWRDGTWIPASSEDTGVTVTSWVS